MKKMLLVLILSAFLGQIVSAAEDISLLRYPDISADGKHITFSYRGDIWISSINGGSARRLTDHMADDIRPVFSPDGKQIAFSSERKGNYDVYVTPFAGGAPQRVTFRSSDDFVTDWTSDSKQVIFYSARDIHHYYGNNGTYKIAVDGGMPVPLIHQMAKYSKLSANDSIAAFNINRMPDFRQRYRGSANYDIYTCHLETKTYAKLTTHMGNDKWPVLAGSQIYYVSDKGNTNTFNIWRMNIDGSGKTQVTFHKGDQVRYPAVSNDGKTVVYEYMNKLYRKDEDKEPYPLKIYAPSDYKTERVTVKHYTAKAFDMKVSPQEEFIAFVIRGEIFVLKKEWEKAKNITNNSAREKDISWSPDGKSILFTSDRNGNNDLFLISPSGSSEKDIYHTFAYDIQQLTDSPAEEHSAIFSPDGKKLAYIEGNGNLVIADHRGKNKKYVEKNWNMDHIRWSPDSNYLAFSRQDNNFNEDVYIYSLEQGKIFNISMHPDDDQMPRWSPDGRFIYFLSKRADNNTDIWRVALTKQWFDMSKDEWKEFLEKEEEEKEKNKNKKESDKKKKKAVQPLSIDFNDIHLRMTHLTRLLGDEEELVVTKNSKNVIFTAENDEGTGIYSIKWDGKDKKVLMPKAASTGDLSVEGAGNYFYYRSGGKFYKINIKKLDKKETTTFKAKNIPFKARLVLDSFKENAQKFDEGWRAMRDKFYDGNFHGADWQGLYRKYRPWAVGAFTILDFNYVFTMMLGELNASHLRISPPDRGRKKPGDVTTGLIGVLFDPGFNGPGFKVKKVLRDSPADKYHSKLYQGDIITAINGEAVGKNQNFYRLMENRADEKVLLEVVRSKGKKKEKQRINIEITSIPSQSDMIYKTWVHETREKVNRLSAGKFAYLHIEVMGWSSLEKFEDELFSVANGKEGLIIDVRYNGGGWITDYLLQILMTKQHAVTIPRGGGKGYPHGRRSIFSWSKPIVVLINHQSYSNAEIFPWAIRTLKRGPIVGKQTFGAVISTGGTRLIDRSWLRLPFRGWYVNDGTTPMVNQELNGCPPDYPVENPPGEESAGKDRQLEKAIEVLKQEVEKSKKDKIWKG